jgi:hypothetical protein
MEALRVVAGRAAPCPGWSGRAGAGAAGAPRDGGERERGQHVRLRAGFSAELRSTCQETAAAPECSAQAVAARRARARTRRRAYVRVARTSGGQHASDLIYAISSGSVI